MVRKASNHLKKSKTNQEISLLCVVCLSFIQCSIKTELFFKSYRSTNRQATKSSSAFPTKISFGQMRIKIFNMNIRTFRPTHFWKLIVRILLISDSSASLGYDHHKLNTLSHHHMRFNAIILIKPRMNVRPHAAMEDLTSTQNALLKSSKYSIRRPHITSW